AGSGVSAYAGCPDRYDSAYAAGLSTASSSRSLGRWQWQWQQHGSPGSVSSSSASGSTVLNADEVGGVDAAEGDDATEADDAADDYEAVRHYARSLAEVNGVAPAPAEAPGPAMPSAAAIAQIFRVGQPPARARSSGARACLRRAARWLGVGRRSGVSAGAVRDAEAALARAVRVLARVRDSQSAGFRARAAGVHAAQARLLALVHGLSAAALGAGGGSSRHYRVYLPEEDQAELDRGFSESVLFAAQALARGFQIRGTEPRTPALRDPAALLCAAWAAVRHVLHAPPSPPDASALAGVLADFDGAWVRFERDLCFAYFGLPASAAADDDALAVEEGDAEFALLAVLLSEALQRAVAQRLLARACVDAMAPRVMLALPRLAIAHAIRHAHPADALSFVDPVFWWFRDYAPQCARIAHALARTPPPLYDVLVRMLVAEEADVVLAEHSDMVLAEHSGSPKHSDMVLAEHSGSGSGSPKYSIDDLESIIDSPRSARSMSVDCISSIIDSPRIGSAIHSTASTAAAAAISATSSAAAPATASDMKQIYVDVCTVADSLHSGPFARPFR
ncbi:hypothetical protein GGF42_008588, partial [Coemansia sp. RSA 2424]